MIGPVMPWAVANARYIEANASRAEVFELAQMFTSRSRTRRMLMARWDDYALVCRAMLRQMSAVHSSST